MGLNVGYLKSDRTIKGDEIYTPFYAVDPILKHLKPNSTIWCPFDEEWSAFVVMLREYGHKVIATHLDRGGDFFTTNVEADYIISNPPYSVKDKVLERLYKIGTPFMMLLPVASIQSIFRVNLFIKYGLQLIVFDRRIGYHTDGNKDTCVKGNSFGSAYFCWNVLNDDIIFKNLTVYNRSLNEPIK